MGYTVLSNRNQINYGIKNLIVDTLKDMKKLPPCQAGTTIYCIETQKTYVMNSQGYWQEAPGLNGGNGGNQSISDSILDGTELPENPSSTGDSEQIQDGGSATGN